MSKKVLKLFLLILSVSISISGFSQVVTNSSNLKGTIIDSLSKSGIITDSSQEKPEIILTTEQAVRFLQQRFQPQYWRNIHDPFRLSIGQLVYEASHAPFDSLAIFLKRYPYDSISIPWNKFYIWEPLRLKIPVIVPPEHPIPVDTTMITDSSKIAILAELPSSRSIARLKDTTILVIIDTLNEVHSVYSKFPFTSYSYPYQSDSIRVAVTSLLNYLEERDSTIINFTGIGDSGAAVWLNSKSDRMVRYWLKNELNDSVTVWIGAPSRNTISLYLEQGISFRRPGKQENYSDARIDLKELDRSKLLDVQKITIKPQYWKYHSEASFALNQAQMTNWVKGGESNISTTFDITGYANYTNKDLKLSSNNFARLKFGIIALEVADDKWDIRKNLDLLETNSKLNHKAFGKFDVSGILLFKTQIAPGYNYPNDSVKVSKFMNPGILTIGIGLDYKPNKNTSINFSPFSYKGTFVPDTAKIDQTKYGIANDKRSKNEPGASFMISHEYKPYKTVSVINRLQLFTNYINNPLNIDVDWEMIVTANLNWFTDVRFNTHLIFDDDTKTTVLKDGIPVLDSYGKPKKVARIQFKELLGFSFVFRF
jgi:hypothetical protein